MITRDFSVISMTSQASLSLSLLLTKVTHAQYRKRFRASYNNCKFGRLGNLDDLDDLASLDDSSICIALHLHWLGKGESVKKIVWIGERENGGMKAFSLLFLQTLAVIYGQSCSEQQKKCAIVRVCLNSQSISCTSGRCEAKECGDLNTAPNAVHVQ